VDEPASEKSGELMGIADGGIAGGESVKESLPKENPSEASRPDSFGREVHTEQRPEAKTHLIDLTWADCRRRAKELNQSEKSYCDTHYLSLPKGYLFEIRWVFLYSFEQHDAWVQERLKLMNEHFAPANIQFKTQKVTFLPKTILAESGHFDDRKTYKVQQLGYELNELLGMSKETVVGDALAEWKRRLSHVGVPSQQVQSLSLSATFSPKVFLNRVARSMERTIFIFVAKKLTTKQGNSPGGFASLPTFNESSIARGSVFLKQDYRADAGAHELGHFFGLRHTQSTSPEWKLPFSVSNACKPFLSQGLTSLKSTLSKYLGADFKKPLTIPYLPYNASGSDVSDFRSLRCAIENTWGKKMYTFHKVDQTKAQTWKPFATQSDFLTHFLAGNTSYEKLYSSVANGKTSFNCGWDGTKNMIACKYGEDVFTGDSSLLMNSIAFENGVSSNLMSYLNSSRFPRRLLAKEQIDLIRLHSHTVERQALKNHLIK
jgi:hypothetical protein